MKSTTNTRATRATLWLALLVLLSATPGASPGLEAEKTPDPIVIVEHVDDDLAVSASIRIAAPPAVVWDAMTDYDRLSLYIEPLESSRLLEVRNDSTYLIEQTSIASFAFIKKKSRARFLSHHHGQTRISTTFIEGDFERYDAEWHLREHGAGSGTVVSYQASFRSTHRVPRWIVRRAVSRSIEKTLTGLRRESLSRHDTLTRPQNDRTGRCRTSSGTRCAAPSQRRPS